MSSLSRGEVAEAAGVNIETLRYYEKRRLIPAPARSHVNYRRYPQDTIARVRFVKHAQDLGFTLEEIVELLALRTTRGAKASQVKQRAQKKLAQIEGRIAALQQMRDALAHLIEECSGEGPATTCTILHAITNGTSHRTTATQRRAGSKG